MISVIVPVYNVEQYLCRCVESILDQSYRELEIVLVDDGSSDRCSEICDLFALRDQRIKVIHQNNGGLAAARNTGLEVASGEYVAFVDSDDTIDPDMYRYLISILEQTGTDIAICGYQKTTENSRIEKVEADKIEFRTLTKHQLWEEVFGQLNNAAWNKLYKRKVIGNLRFPQGIIHGEDLIFNLDYLCKCASGVIGDAKLYHYYSRSGSITRSAFSEKKINEIVAKDLAKNIILKWMPDQLDSANKYCFRARMNVLRSVHNAKVEKEYGVQVQSCIEYVRCHYSEVKHLIRTKESIEYYLLRYCRPLYKALCRR